VIKKTGRLGLSLIELLIIVAIIAILAAYTIPKFPSHGTPRSPISRALNDIRTLRTGVEAYAVDNVSVPRMTWASVFGDTYKTDVIQRGYLWNSTQRKRVELYATLAPHPALDANGKPVAAGMGGAITTPISYLSVLPHDPFNDTSVNGGLYMYLDLKTCAELLEKGAQTSFPGQRFPYAPKNEQQLKAFEEWFGAYVIWCAGPQGLDGFRKNNTPIFLQYDPTNGTESPGALFVSQKFFEPKWVDWRALEN
jgi:Tfp pilus assembly protein PilE